MKASQIKQLEKLSKRRPVPDRIVSVDLAREMCAISAELNRQVGLLLDRRGRSYGVILGDARGVFLPEIQRRGRERLCGLRLIHTHVHEEALNDDDLTDLALLRLDWIAVITLKQGTNEPGVVHMAHLMPANDTDEPWEILPPTTVYDMEDDFLEVIGALEDEIERSQKPRVVGDTRDRAILIHVGTEPRSVAEDSLDELKELARSSGMVVAHTLNQRRKPDRKFVTGQGKMKAVVIKAMQLGAEVVVFDLDLSPSQMKALSDLTDLKIIDRTQLILDIFAQHAVTRDGKLQVELAQLRYLLPLLSLRQTALSRLTGGIGGRGPGETRLEVDRRRANDRIAQLEREVKKLGKRRELQRGVRTRKGVPTLAVVGYTNAGKSTLLNHLTNSDVTAEDALFATLNPVSRRLRFPEDREIIITDTVGFIRNLPKELMAAFRTTFEELHEADLLLHVIDASAHDFEDKYETVEMLINDLNLEDKPILVVLNKQDKAEPETLLALTERYQGIPICACDKSTFPPLVDAIKAYLWDAKETSVEAAWS